MSKPFSESAIFDFVMTGSAFYASGSEISIGEKPGTLSGPLRDKEQIKLSFAVKNKVFMLPKSSSIYYFDVKASQWILPTGSVSDHVGPMDKFAINTSGFVDDSGFPPVYSGSVGSGYTNGTRITEDYKGFDPYGRAVMSGNLNLYRQVTYSNGQGPGNEQYNQTDHFLGTRAFFPPSKFVDRLTEDYPKSVQRSLTYDAGEDQTFQLDIRESFLLEKAVIEIPFCMGSSWFQDKSLTTIAIASGSYSTDSNPFSTIFYDAGGPGLTVSLFCQKNYGIRTDTPERAQGKVRDLILTGVITHELDQSRNSIRKYFGNNSLLQFRLAQGIQGAAAYVERDVNSQFTGTVKVQSAAAVSNGLNSSIIKVAGITGSVDPAFINTKAWPIVFTPEGYLERVRTQIENKRINVRYLVDQTALGTAEVSNMNFTCWDPLGRGMTGFSPSGGSIFGREHTMYNNTSKDVPNPWYIEDPADRAAFYQEVSSTVSTISTPYISSFTPLVYSTGLMMTFYELCNGGTMYSSSKYSPYLLRPGDKLMLAVSKTRPAISESKSRVLNSTDASYGKHSLRGLSYLTGSSTGHDVTLSTGSINITLYGSYVREGKVEFSR